MRRTRPSASRVDLARPGKLPGGGETKWEGVAVDNHQHQRPRWRSEPLTVLHVVGGLNRGGAETLLLNVLQREDPAHFRFLFLCYGDAEFDYADRAIALGASVLRVPPPTVTSWPHVIRRLRRLVRDERVDVIHCHTQYNSWLGVVCARMTRVPVMVHSHTVDIPATLAGRRLGMRQRLYRGAAGLIIRQLATARVACSLLAGRALFHTRSYEVVPSGVDFDAVTFSPQARSAVRSDLKLRDDSAVMVCVGRLSPEKNQEFLIRVIHDAHRRGKDVDLVLAGAGPQREHLERLSIHLGVGDQVHFLGSVPPKMVGQILSAADLAGYPSVIEGFGMAAVEARVNGVDCWVSPAIPDQVATGAGCRTLPIDQGANVWAKALLGVEARSATRADTGALRQGSVFDVGVTTQTLNRIYERLARP